MTERHYGWKAGPSPTATPAKKFGTLKPRLTLTETGPDVDLSKYCTVFDQGSLSSCVGNGTAGSLDALEAVAHEGIAGWTLNPVSRLFVYNMARIEEGALAQDDGTHVSTAFDVLSRYGSCPETLWPYDTDKVFTSPSLLAQRAALGHKISAYYQIDSSGDQRIADVVTALRAKHFPVFGTTVTKAFEKLTTLGPVDPPGSNDTIAGAHCMMICGYIGGNFLVKNSWGTGWGKGGFFLMTPAYLTCGFTEDIWVPTLGIDFDAP